MKGQADMTNVQEGGTFPLVEEGVHFADIVECKDGTSKNGDPIVAIKLVVKSGVSQDAWVWDNITISNNPQSPGYKILGRSMHFLHCIGEPYEGKIEYDSDRWLWKEVKIKVTHEAPNQYHKYTKAIVSEYLLDEEPSQSQSEDTPDL